MHTVGGPGDRGAEWEVPRRQDPDASEPQPDQPEQAQQRDSAARAREPARPHPAGIGEHRRDQRRYPLPADVDDAHRGARCFLGGDVASLLNRTHPTRITLGVRKSQALVRRGSEP
jgi:hypothetical protein